MPRAAEPLSRLHNMTPEEKKEDALRFVNSCSTSRDPFGIKDLCSKLKNDGEGFLRTACKSHLCHMYGYDDAEAAAVIDEYIRQNENV